MLVCRNVLTVCFVMNGSVDVLNLIVVKSGKTGDPDIRMFLNVHTPGKIAKAHFVESKWKFFSL